MWAWMSCTTKGSLTAPDHAACMMRRSSGPRMLRARFSGSVERRDKFGTSQGRGRHVVLLYAVRSSAPGVVLRRIRRVLWVLVGFAIIGSVGLALVRGQQGGR